MIIAPDLAASKLPAIGRQTIMRSMRSLTPSEREVLRRKLRRLGVVRGTDALPPSSRRRVAIESVTEGEFYETPAGRCFVATHTFPTEHRHGDLPLGAFLDLDPRVLAALGSEPALAEVDPSAAVFLDTETTGLSGGTGTMAFLVGIGYFDHGRFRVLQAFLRDPGDEPAMVDWLAERLSAFQMVVTFNGRGFDLPILENRFILARRPFPLADTPHLDLLPASRRVWRWRLTSCALGTLEREVLGVERDQADIPSGVIPHVYRDYLRTGDAREIPRILYHNRMDVMSLTGLATRLAQALSDPLGQDWLEGPDLYAIAWWPESDTGAEPILRAALSTGLPQHMRLRALKGLALLLKRQRRWSEAIEWWQQLAVENPNSVTAAVELAKIFEWRIPRPDLAMGWARLAQARASRLQEGRRERALDELTHRLARLVRKARG